MPRLLFAVLACFALLLPIGGCYRYDASAKNLTNRSVRVSLHKGRYQREISTAVLAPGTAVEWNGAVNGPVFLRVSAVGDSVDVSLPRRAYTELGIGLLDGQLNILKTVEGESFAVETGCPEDCPEPCCAAEGGVQLEEAEPASCCEAQAAAADDDAGGLEGDSSESFESETPEDEVEMIELIEPDEN